MPFSLDYYFSSLGGAAGGGLDPHGIPYMEKHRLRFEKTLDFIEGISGNSALEIGATDFFQVYLRESLGFQDVWASIFTQDIAKKRYLADFEVGEYKSASTVVSVNLEGEFFPISGPRFDFVMMCEVIEHFDVDPMFALCELNRIMRDGAKLLITTPNACSARNAYKACLGYRPHFYMQYSIDRDPYRHNFEHDIHSIKALLEGAGFRLARIEAHDVFDVTDEEAIAFLDRNGMPLELRGDDLFVLAEKVSSPVDRWPEGVYTPKV